MNPDLHTPVSPKVSWGAAAGLLAAVLAAVIGALVADPSGLGFDLPVWAVFLILSGGPVVVQALAAYARRDPLRDEGAAALAAEAETRAMLREDAGESILNLVLIVVLVVLALVGLYYLFT